MQMLLNFNYRVIGIVGKMLYQIKGTADVKL